MKQKLLLILVLMLVLDARAIAVGTDTIAVDPDSGVVLSTISGVADFQFPGKINKLTLTQPATAATITIANGKTLTHNATTTFSGVDGKTETFNNSLTFGGTDGKSLTLTGGLTVGADTTINGGGTLALGGKTVTHTATTTFGGVDGKTETFNNSLTFAGTDAKSLTLTGSLSIGADTTISGGGTLALGGFTGTLPATGTFALASGISGGQTINGGTASGNNLTLNSTSNATKGKIFFGANSAYDGANNRLGIGTTSPSQSIESAGNIFINNPVANLFLKDTSTGFQAAATTVVTPQSGNSFQSISYTSGLRGFHQDDNYAEFNNINVRGELRASVFKVNEISATAGTSGTFYSASALTTDMTTPANVTTVASGSNNAALPQSTINVASTTGFASSGTIYVEGATITYTGKTSTSFTGCSGGSGTMNTGDAVSDTIFGIAANDSDAVSSAMLFGVGDILRIKAFVNSGSVIVADIWLVVQSGRVNHGTFASYPVILLSGTGNTTIPAGTAVIDYGPSGTGFVTQSADGTVGASPNITMATHSGSPWKGLDTKFRAGNLNGSYGYAADTYGIGLGQYGVSGGVWQTLDTTNGLRLGNNTDVLGAWDTAGNITVGPSTTANVFISGTTGSLNLRSGAANILRIDTSAGLQMFDPSGNSLIQLDTSGNSRFGRTGAGNSNVFVTSAGALNLRNNTTNVLTLDTTNGLQMLDSSGNSLTQLDTSGNSRFGRTGAGNSNVFVTSAGALNLRNNTTNVLTLDTTNGLQMLDSSGNSLTQLDTSGNARFGRQATSKANVYFNSGNGRLEFRGGTSGTSVQSYIDTDGSFVSGSVKVNSLGMSISTGSSTTDASSILWLNGATEYGRVTATGSASGAELDLVANGSTAGPTLAIIKSASGQYAKLQPAPLQTLLGMTINSVSPPAHMFDVNGDAWVQSTMQADGGFVPPTSTGTSTTAMNVSGGTSLTIAQNATATPVGSSTTLSGLLIASGVTINGVVGVFAFDSAGVTLLAGGATWSTTQGNAGTMNVYKAAGVLTFENKRAGTENLKIMVLRTR